MAVWMFTALWAWLFSRHNTVGAADCCGVSCDERSRKCCSLCCHIVSAQVCTDSSVSSVPVTLLPVYVSVTTSCRWSDWTQTANNKWHHLTVNTAVSTNNLSPNLWFSTTKEVYALQMVIMFVCFIVYNESTAVTEKCVLVYRTAWI